MIGTRRNFLALSSVVIGGGLSWAQTARAAAFDLAAIPIEFHERAMRAAMAVGRTAYYPFGAVIVRPPFDELLARGANDSRSNPTYHGEIVTMNDYVARHGNQGWGDCVLYTTAEPCPMCMSALTWARIGAVVYATSIATLTSLGLPQIAIPASEVVAAASFHHVALLGGVLARETDAMFAERLRH